MAESPDKNAPLGTPDEEKLKRWRSEFQTDFRSRVKWYENKKEWERFYDGDQLSSEEKQALKARNQPEVVINLIKPRLDSVIGDYLGRRVMMRARDRGSSDFDKAKHITEALRYIEDQNHFDESEAKVAEDLGLAGEGWYKIGLRFDFLEPEIKITYRPNDDIVIDRHCRQRNLIDAKRLYETFWVEAEDLIEVYPDQEEFIMDAIAMQPTPEQMQMVSQKGTSYIGDDYAQSESVTAEVGFDFETFIDIKRRRIRLTNIWERVQKRVEFAFHPDLKEQVVEISSLKENEKTTFNHAFPDAQKFTQTRWELNSGIFIANKILEDKENIRAHDSEGKFPFARALGNVERETRMPYGLIRQYIDPQKEYNKRRSKLLHKSNVNRIEAEEGAFSNNDIERIRQEAAKPDGVVLYKAGRQMKIERDQPNQTDVYLLELSHSEIERSGVSREFIGQEDKVLSGKAINLRQIDGSKMIRPFYAALRSARRDTFNIVLEEMQQYWTATKLIKITDDPEAGQIILNQRVYNPDSGKVEIINDLRLGKYDIKIDEDLETPNQRQETFNQLAQLGQVALQAGEPFPLEMLIKSSELPNKKEWLDAIAQRRQQQMQQLQAQLMAQAGAAPPNGQLA